MKTPSERATRIEATVYVVVFCPYRH